MMPLPYVIESPNEGEPPESGWPLIIFLHGTTERGTNFKKLRRLGPLAYRDEGGSFAGYVAVPQCPNTTKWQYLYDELMQWLDILLLKHPIDPKRLTLTGFSLGGFATLDWAYRNPDLFAALVPVAGLNTPDDKRNPCLLASIAMWIFAGRKDKVLTASDAEAFVTSMKSCGATPRYTLYNTNHIETARSTYRNQELYNWILVQRRI